MVSHNSWPLNTGHQSASHPGPPGSCRAQAATRHPAAKPGAPAPGDGLHAITGRRRQVQHGAPLAFEAGARQGPVAGLEVRSGQRAVRHQAQAPRGAALAPERGAQVHRQPRRAAAYGALQPRARVGAA